MSEPKTDLAVILLTSLAALTTLFAWWLSARRSRQTGRLIAYIKRHHGAYWDALPRLSRALNPAGSIEAYRRSAASIEPEFLLLYQERRRRARAELMAIGVAIALIGVLAAGTTLWGWSW